MYLGLRSLAQVIFCFPKFFPPLFPFDEPRKLEPGFSKFEDKNTALIKSLDLIYFWPKSLFAPVYRGEYAIWKSYQTGLSGFHHCKGISSFERQAGTFSDGGLVICGPPPYKHANGPLFRGHKGPPGGDQLTLNTESLPGPRIMNFIGFSWCRI